MTIIERAEELGGNRWTKGDLDRIYLKLDQAGVLNVTRYRTGNLSSATWANGDPISNGRASSLLDVKIWLDVATMTLHYKTLGTVPDGLERAISALKALLTEESVTA